MGGHSVEVAMRYHHVEKVREEGMEVEEPGLGQGYGGGLALSQVC